MPRSYMGKYKDHGVRGALQFILIPICIVYQYNIPIPIPMPRSYMGEYKDHGGCGALQCIFTDAATLCRPAPPLSCRGIHLLPSCHIQLACCIIILLHRHSAGIMSKLGQLYAGTSIKLATWQVDSKKGNLANWHPSENETTSITNICGMFHPAGIVFEPAHPI